MNLIRKCFNVGMDAFNRFLSDDGWAIASHIALSMLMAIFPFLIVLTSLAGFIGSKDLADSAAELMLNIWPERVSGTISNEVHNVLSTTRTDALTIGLVLAMYFASNGVESLRIALNRAYGVVETRAWYWLRLESIGYTVMAAVSALAMAFLLVLGPLMLETARHFIPLVIETNERMLTFARYGISGATIVAALFVVHAFLPAGRRTFRQIMPGILFTMVASLISSIGFGMYLARFANNYVTMYSGLASAVIALVFLYFISAIFVFGGELNAAIMKANLPEDVSLQKAQSLEIEETPA